MHRMMQLTLTVDAIRSGTIYAYTFSDSTSILLFHLSHECLYGNIQQHIPDNALAKELISVFFNLDTLYQKL